MLKLTLSLLILLSITLKSNSEEATSSNLLPNAGTGQTSLQNSSGSIDGFNSTSNWTMSGTTYYPNEIEATGTGTVSANGSLLNITTEKENSGQFTTTANSLDGGVRLNSTTEVQNCEWVGSAHQCGQASSGGGQRDSYSTTVKILDESNGVLGSVTQNRNNDAGYYSNTFTYTDTVIHNGTGARNWSWEWRGIDGGNTSSTAAIGPNLVGAELTATLLDIDYTPLPPAIQTEITEVFEELFEEFEEIEQIVELNFEEEFEIIEELEMEEVFEIFEIIEMLPPPMEEEPKMTKLEVLETFEELKEEMPMEIVEEFEEFIEEKEEMIMEVVEEFEELKEEKEEKPIMNKQMEVVENEEKEEEKTEEIAEESNSEEPTRTAESKTESRKEQKEKIREAKADARLVKTLNKIDEKIKEVDKNLQAKNFIKINAMVDNSILLTYNVPFYKEEKIYEDQLNIFDNRLIYTRNLAEYQQNDPIFTKQNEINSIRLEKQKLIREIEVLTNG
jgi:hypothetical protein